MSIRLIGVCILFFFVSCGNGEEQPANAPQNKPAEVEILLLQIHPCWLQEKMYGFRWNR